MSKKVQVIYILGEGRSGSTLIERILGQHSEIFAAGELKHIWERSFIENQLCSCGKKFKECNIWQKIIQDLEPYNIDPYEQMDVQNKISRLRHYFKLKKLKKNATLKNDDDLMKLANTYYTLYRSILKSTGKKYVLDASKHPVFAFILSMHPKIELHTIHLVRDLRGVAYAWTKKKIRPEITTHKELMPQYSVLRTSASWDIVNFIGEKLKNYAHSYTLIRYEDIISDPQKHIQKIFDHLNLNNEIESIFTNDQTVNLKTNHTVAGNPMRFTTGPVTLTLDEKWKVNMSTKDKLISKILGYPYLFKYGYLE